MKRIQKEWENFRHGVVPAGASKIQVECMREAFFAGATVITCLLGEMVADEDVSEDDQVAVLIRLQDEMIEFAQSKATKH